MLILAMGMAFETGYARENDSLIRLLDYHFERYPEMQTDDIYKMLYQGSMGVGHFIGNPEGARRYLEREYTQVIPDHEIPLAEPVSISGDLVRLNIAPYKALGGDVESLFRAMMKTAGEFQPAKTDLIDLLQQTVILSETNIIPIEPAEFSDLMDEVAEYDYPAVHHSDIYREAYKPAYRVILRKYAEELK